MSEFTKGLKSKTIVDDTQRIDPAVIKEFIQERRDMITHPELQNRALIMIEELVDLVDQAEFLNHVRQERMNLTANEMGKEAGL